MYERRIEILQQIAEERLAEILAADDDQEQTRNRDLEVSGDD